MSPHSPSEPLPEAFLHLGAILLDEQSLDGVLQHVLGLTSRALPSVTEASISLARNGTVFTSNATDVLAATADQAQYDTDGPCLWAIRTSAQHLVHFPRDNGRWPSFAAVITDAGMASVLSTPLRTGEATLGALNLYSRAPEGFGPDEQALATEFARHTSILLSNAIAFTTKDTLAHNLQEALTSREMIGIATGLLMGRPSRTRQEAFDVLRRASQRENRKLRDIAADLVAGAEERGGPDAAPQT